MPRTGITTRPHREDGSHRSGAASLNLSVGSHIVVCSSCGRENDADARFCNTCGERLDAQPGEAATRKVVTVVFTDVVGSTALGERLDPESLRHVMWRYFDTMQATLERHGGTVEKFIGDAIVAVFGVPAVHEDDAVRAVRAAFEMREALARVNDDLAREYGVRIATRTGVNTGEVIVGDGAADQKLVTGDAVNVAARLEQAAPGERGAHRPGDLSPRPGRRRRRAGVPCPCEGQESAARSMEVAGPASRRARLFALHRHAVHRSTRRARRAP